MPKELRELVGEPIGFGDDKHVNSEGQEVVIKRAFLINDICPKIKDKEKWKKILICFTESKKLGRCVVILEVLDEPDVEGKRLIFSTGIPVSFIEKQFELASCFFETLHERYGVSEEQIVDLI